MLDCLVIGGGPAGLTAGIYLARYRRDLRILDAGSPRAALIPTTHNFPGFPDGVSGEHLLARLRDQASTHGVAITEARVESLERQGEGFVARAGEQSWAARNVILATGVRDQHPDFPGLREATLAGLVRWCPICDGFEVTDKSIAVLAPAGPGLGHALFLRTYSRRITLLALPGEGLDADDLARMEGAGVEMVTEAVVSLEPNPAGPWVQVNLADGSSRRFDVLYPMQGCSVQAELAIGLGAACQDDGDLIVDASLATTVPGLYAIGDVVNAINQISVAIGHAAIAATAVHRRLPPNPR